MKTDKRLSRINRIVIMIILGTFTAAELMYLAPEYKWGLSEVREIVAMILS